MKLTIELPDDALSALRAKAEKRGVTAEEYVSRIVDLDLKQHDKARQNPKLRHISEVMAEIMADVSPDEQR